jgi:hypothetical protein
MTEPRSFLYRRGEQVTPPPARQTSDVTVMRFDGIYEVDPRLMQQVPQQPFPKWDTLRIADSREHHLEWMHHHFARKVLSGERILADILEGEAQG